MKLIIKDKECKKFFFWNLEDKFDVFLGDYEF